MWQLCPQRSLAATTRHRAQQKTQRARVGPCGTEEDADRPLAGGDWRDLLSGCFFFLFFFFASSTWGFLFLCPPLTSVIPNSLLHPLSLRCISSVAQYHLQLLYVISLHIPYLFSLRVPESSRLSCLRFHSCPDLVLICYSLHSDLIFYACSHLWSLLQHYVCIHLFLTLFVIRFLTSVICATFSFPSSTGFWTCDFFWSSSVKVQKFHNEVEVFNSFFKARRY